MKIAIACDHGGFPLKDTILETVRAAGHEPIDLGAFNAESSDYPDFAQKVGQAINDGMAQLIFPATPVRIFYSTSASNTDPLQKDWMMDPEAIGGDGGGTSHRPAAGWLHLC